MTHCYRSGNVEIRPVERLLRVDAQPAAIGARAFDLLLTLIEHRDRVVSHDELLDRVWPGLVVEVNNLAVQVAALRKVLGHQAIATIPGRGYRFALTLEDGAAALAAAATPSAPTSTVRAMPPLPALAGALIGRDADLAAVVAASAEHRLLTLVGIGGIGKTALALAAARCLQQAGGAAVAWVELASLSGPGMLHVAVAQALGLAPSAAADPLPTLLEGLRPLTLHLVLDGAEPLAGATARLASEILARAPRVHLLVTSQLPLKVEGERVYRLDALSVPADEVSADDAQTYGAVALFAACAAAADRRFVVTPANVGMVVDLCRRLDGIPLALLLAAARVPLLGVQGIHARLAERLKLLRGGAHDAPARQQTLRAALDWSHDLLDVAAQKVLRRAALFAGGFSLDLAAAVASDAALDEWAVIEALGVLLDRSLVTMDTAEAPRYRLLESTRDYARLKLDEAGEREATQRSHAHAVAAAFDRAYVDYWASADEPWLVAWAPEADNLRAALAWAQAQEPALALRLMGASCPLFLTLGLAHEGRQRCAALHAAALQAAAGGLDKKPPDSTLARYWLEQARLHWGISSPLMHDCALRAADLSRASGDAPGLYMALRCLIGSKLPTAAQARLALQEMSSLGSPQWPTRLRAQGLFAEITVLKAEARLELARTASEQLLALADEAGLHLVRSAALNELASQHLALGQPAAAAATARRVVDHPARRRDSFFVHAHATLVQAALDTGDFGDARAAMADFIAASRSRDWEWFDLYADLYALLAACEARPRSAAKLLGHADAAARRTGERNLMAAAARARAGALVETALPQEDITRLATMGAQADIESVCRWTLGEADA